MKFPDEPEDEFAICTARVVASTAGGLTYCGVLIEPADAECPNAFNHVVAAVSEKAGEDKT